VAYHRDWPTHWMFAAEVAPSPVELPNGQCANPDVSLLAEARCALERMETSTRTVDEWAESLSMDISSCPE
jgi:hypothetical protein